MLGGEGCSELRSHHYTVAWATEQDSVEGRKEGRKGGREGGREGEGLEEED